jgi:hypothetical protein
MICHQVLWHPSGHGTSSMGKHLMAKANIAMLNELTESDVSELATKTIDVTALPILKGQGSRGITMVRLHKQFIFDSLVVLIVTLLPATTL